MKPVSLDQNQFPLVVRTLQGLEEVLAAELKELGVAEVQTFKRAVAFEGDLEMMYRCNYHLRTALRVLVKIYQFRARNEQELYDGIQQLDWRKYLIVTQTLSVHCTTHSPHFKHSQYAALKTKDAIVDQFRKYYHKRPSVDTQNPHLRIHVHINGDQVRVLLDSSGDSLHLRGYRSGKHIAPLNEVLAAGMLKLANWTGSGTFVDPMCGSGTLPIEAALMARNLAAGTFRKHYGFQKWRNYNPALFQQIKMAARKAKTECNAQIFASDISAQNIAMAQEHATKARVKDFIQFEVKPIAEFKAPAGPGLAMINPPYGERIVPTELEALYKQIGDCLKQGFLDYEAWILSSNQEAMKHIGLRAGQRLQLYNGALVCRFYRYKIYSGSQSVAG